MKLPPIRFLKFPLIGFCCLIFLTSWALSSPPGSNSDDEYHLAGIWCAFGERTQICSVDEITGRKSVPRQIQRYSGPQGIFCYAGNEKASARCIRELSPEVVMELVPTGRISEGQYPSGFYKANGFLVGGNINRSILNMRFLQISIAFVVFSLAIYTAREKASQILTGLFIGLVPIGLWVIPSTQPASWSIIGLVGLGIYLVGFTRDRTTVNLLLVGIGSLFSIFLALQSRRDSPLILLIVLLLFLISQYKTFFRHAIKPFMRALVLVIIPIAAALVHFRFIPLSSILQFRGIVDSNIFEGALNTAPNVILGLIGGSRQLGSPDFAPPLLVLVLLIISLGIYLSARLPVIPREARLSAFIGGFFLFLMPLRFALENVGDPVSRYIYVVYLTILVQIAASAKIVTAKSLNYEVSLNRIIVFSTALAHALALHQTLRRYLTGTNTTRFDLNFGAEWWWSRGLSPMSVWLIGSISFTLAMSLTLQISRVRR